MDRNFLPQDGEEIEETYFWLSLDEEGAELAKQALGTDFTEKYKKCIESERLIQKKIIQKAFPMHKCPEYLMFSVEKLIMQDKNILKASLLRKILYPIETHKSISLAFLTVVLIMGITILLQTQHLHNIKLDNENLKKKLTLLESQNNINTINTSQPSFDNYADAIFISFEDSQQTTDPNFISNLILNKTKTITIDVDKLQNYEDNIQLVGYREDTIDDDFIIQIIFQTNEQKYKVIVSPCTQKSINLYEKAILEGKVREIRTLENHLIGLVGEPGIPTCVLNCFVHLEDINLPSIDPKEENLTPDSNNLESSIENKNIYSPPVDTITEGLISSKIYEMEDSLSTPPSNYETTSSI